MVAVFTLALVFLFSLAGRVSAFTWNVTFGGEQLFADQLLPTSYPAPIDRCQQNCTKIQDTLTAANNNATIICDDDTLKQFQVCEQCMFQAAVDKNIPLVEPKAGSNPMIQGYGAACALFNITFAKNQTNLAIADNWDGPFGMFVPTGGLVVTVGVGAILGVSSIVLLSAM
ncbi:hypothetical protein VKT23_016396 [Stygiomarasmius scandens]|uniref:Uncharacterized protein n=1 Tax=Marasmiellus scandens TaxID=2682957 RepID=A0ABR1IV16_9AGAR